MKEKMTEYSNLTETNGDVIELFKSGKYDILAQGNNCFCTQKSGVARAIVEEWPEVLDNDKKSKKGDEEKLGSFYETNTEYGTVLGIYTQYSYGRDGQDRFEYWAFKNALTEINEKFKNKHILFPKIGGGLSGGNFDKIKNTIIECLTDMKVTICYL